MLFTCMPSKHFIIVLFRFARKMNGAKKSDHLFLNTGLLNNMHIHILHATNMFVILSLCNCVEKIFNL